MNEELRELVAQALRSGFSEETTEPLGHDLSNDLASGIFAEIGAAGYAVVSVYPTEQVFLGFGSVNAERSNPDYMLWEGDFGNFVASWCAALSAAQTGGKDEP